MSNALAQAIQEQIKGGANLGEFEGRIRAGQTGYEDKDFLRGRWKWSNSPRVAQGVGRELKQGEIILFFVPNGIESDDLTKPEIRKFVREIKDLADNNVMLLSDREEGDFKRRMQMSAEQKN